jgi:hypothetical protein
MSEENPRPEYVPEHLPWPVPKGITKKQQREMGYSWRVWSAVDNPRSVSKVKPRGGNDFMKRLLSTEEGRKLHKMWTDKRFAPGVKRGRPHGSTDGYSRHLRKKITNKAKEEAERIVAYMESTKGFEIPKQDFAKEAITTAVELMRREDMHPKDKLTAARVVLEWTLAKPATESTVNVKTAESFLEDIAAEMNLKK